MNTAEIQELKINNAYSYNGRTKTFAAELSSIHASEHPSNLFLSLKRMEGEMLYLTNSATGKKVLFRFYRLDIDEGDVQGWWFFSTEGFKLLFIND